MTKEKSARTALEEAEALGAAASKRGFDWDDVQGPIEKLREEMEELEAEILLDPASERVVEELGDLLFSVVNVARHLGCDPEEALCGTNEKFRRRIGEVYRCAEEAGNRPEEMELEELESFWQKAKRGEKEGE